MNGAPKYQGIDVKYKIGGDNQDIRNLLESLVPKATKQLAKIASSFQGRNERETCLNIFNYIRKNFVYVADGSEQVIKLPSALMHKKYGDCKSYALFTAGILSNLKIPYELVYTSYSANPIPSHVYVATDNCIIDAVYGIFNEEKPPVYKYKKRMNISYIGSIKGCGVGCNCASCKSANRRKRNRKMNGISGGKSIRKIIFAPGRGLFLAIVKANLDGFASKLQKVDQAKLKRTWENVGGDFTKLVSTIKTGSSKPERKLGLLGMLRKRLKAKGGVNGIGAASDQDIKAAIVAIATTIGTAITPGAGTATGAAIGGVLAEMYPVVKDLVVMTPDAEMTDVAIPNPVTPDASETQQASPETDETSFDIKKALPMIAIAGAALYYVTRK